MGLDFRWRILILILAALLLRALFLQPLTMELDTYFYARQTRDFSNSITTGKIFTAPLNHKNYYGIEYRSPLYPFLAGIAASITGNVEWALLIVSLAAGCLLIIPLFMLARDYWGDPAGDIAGILAAVHPLLILPSTMGRTESLYVLLYTLAVCFSGWAYTRGRWRDYAAAGIFWGLAYQTRFEALAGAVVAAFLLFYRIWDKKSQNKTIFPVVKALAFVLVMALVISPYVIIIYKTSGELHITSPSKKLLDEAESRWIASKQPGGLTAFNYHYGSPGEYDYKALKEITGKNPGEILKENRPLYFTAIIKAIPDNLKMIVSNFNPFLLVLFLIPFFRRDLLKGAKYPVLWPYLLPAGAIVLLSFWDPDPRYYAFMIPLILVNIAGVTTALFKAGEEFTIQNEKTKFLLTWVLLPMSLFSGWYFFLKESLAPVQLQFNGSLLAMALHKSLPILLSIFMTTGILAILSAIIMKKPVLFFGVPAAGLGILSIISCFVDPRIESPVSTSEFLHGIFYSPARWIIICLFALGAFYQGLQNIKSRLKNPVETGKYTLAFSLMALFAISIQNMSLINGERTAYRFANYHPAAVKAAASSGIKPARVMSRHPRDAFALNAAWLQIPPLENSADIREALRKKQPDYIILDSLPANEGKPFSIYPDFLIMSEEGNLVHLLNYKKENPALLDRTLQVRVYRYVDKEKTKGANTNLHSGTHHKQLTVEQESRLGNNQGAIVAPSPTGQNRAAHLPDKSQSESISGKKGNLAHSWPRFHRDERNSGYSPGKGPGGEASVEWKFRAGHEIFSSPAITKDGLVIFGCDDSHVYALDNEGRLKWKFAADYYVSASPAIGPDGTIYIGSDDQHLYALSPQGKIKWKFKTNYYISSCPNFTGKGNIVFGGEDGFLYCLNPDGKLYWKFQTDDEIIGSPVIIKADSTGNKELIVFTNQGGTVFALSPEGKPAWKTRPGGKIITSPAVGNDGVIYAGSLDGNMYALTPEGKIKWKFKAGGKIASSPAVTPDGKVFFGCGDKNLYATAPGGKLLWKFPAQFAIESSPVVDSSGNVYFGSHDRHIYGVNSKGKLVFKIKTGGAVFSSPAIGADGKIYLGSMDKYLYAIYGKTKRGTKSH